jgi:methionyl-tRNA formyltransferase
MKITILIDNKTSWFVEFGLQLKEKLEERMHHVELVFDKREINKGDVCFLLSCSRIVEKEFLDLNINNIVVHASDLPLGKGFSPLQWQILGGSNIIPITLFEAVKDVDAGPYYIKSEISLQGSELYGELRSILGKKIIEMSLQFIDEIQILMPIEQIGDESFFPRRKMKDDEINPNKSINELFNHFRIADNENFPLFFYYSGKKFFLKIYKAEE